jgi:hypothetical protein
MLTKIFPANEHVYDRAFRVVLGIALLAIAFVGPKTPWGYIGVVPLLTGLLGSCPLYTIFGLNTCAVTPKTSSR